MTTRQVRINPKTAVGRRREAAKTEAEQGAPTTAYLFPYAEEAQRRSAEGIRRRSRRTTAVFGLKMRRRVTTASIFVFLSLIIMPPLALIARAQEAEQGSGEDEEEQATKHFAKGRKLYAEGKYKKAIEELLKAYNLRPAPPILLNIARTYEKLGDKKNALKFYKEFLLKARNVDPNRSQVEAVVKTLEKQVGGKTGAVTSAEGTETPTATTTEEGSASMPAGKQQLIHTPVDSVKVNHAITLVAELPPGVNPDRVVLHFRKGGEVGFRELPMQVQGDAYVAQIPARFVTSTSLQYYLEAARGTGRGAVLAQAGTKFTPHIVVIEGGIPIGASLHKAEIRSPYRTWAWVATAGTAAMVGVAIMGMVLAKDRSDAIETVAKSDKNCGTQCQQTGSPAPKERFDTRGQAWENEGKTFATIGYVFLGVGIAAAGVTGYLWVQDQLYLKRERGRRAMNARFMGAPWATAGGGGVVGRIDF